MWLMLEPGRGGGWCGPPVRAGPAEELVQAAPIPSRSAATVAFFHGMVMRLVSLSLELDFKPITRSGLGGP